MPHGHWKTTTFLAALRHDRITAPCVFDGAINGERFRYIEQALAPTLGPGDLVIMDNLGAHKVQGVGEAIEARGVRLLYLPPYAPDLPGWGRKGGQGGRTEPPGGAPREPPGGAPALDLVALHP